MARAIWTEPALTDLREEAGLKQVVERTDASKEKCGRAEALALAKTVDKIVVGKGKKVVTFDMSNPPDDESLASCLLGPTGSLKAPAL